MPRLVKVCAHAISVIRLNDEQVSSIRYSPTADHNLPMYRFVIYVSRGKSSRNRTATPQTRIQTLLSTVCFNYLERLPTVRTCF